MSRNFGVYGQVGGASVSVALGSDGLTIGLGGQLSVGYVVSGSNNFNYSISNGWSIQPSVMHGVGTPTGMPGVTYAVQTSINSPTNQVQVGFGITDVLEAGVSFSTTRNTSAVQDSRAWINEFTGLPGYTQTPTTTTPAQTTPGYRGAGFNDPRLEVNSTAPANAAQVAAQAAEAAAKAEADAKARAKAATKVDTSSSGGSSYDFGGYNGFAGNTTEGSGYGWSMDGHHMAPIVIDLDGDGVELRPLTSSATFFDTDSDTYQERTAWAGTDDGMLVIDLDGDGQVTQAKEIAFAEWTSEQDSDLQALAKVFDSNQDGTFDSRDERFAEFRIWKDANSNGVAANHNSFNLVA